MAIPSQPTDSSISTEAYKLFGIGSPSSSEITRAINEGFEIVKGDLVDMGLEWDFLRSHTYSTLTKYSSKLQLPTDFKKLIDEDSVKVLDGDITGTAQSGGSSTITLASSTDEATENIRSKVVVITGGTGSGQGRQATDYDNSTKQVTVANDWDTTPDNTSTYLVVDREYSLKTHPIHERSSVDLPDIEGRPVNAFIEGDSAEGDLILDRSPDKAYVLRIRYYQDLLKIDLSSTKYNRILRLLNSLFIQGLFTWLLQDDQRKRLEEQKYRSKLERAKMRYLYPFNADNFNSRVDYD